MLRHFLQITDFSADEINKLIGRAIAQKKEFKKNGKLKKQSLAHKTIFLVFDKPSTRTRLSFQSGIHMLGGNAVFVSNTDTQIGRGEPIMDVARVMSRYGQMIMIRTFEQSIIEELAKYSSVPIINGLSNQHHPCQVLADLMTWQEHLGKDKIAGKTVAWLGDANNVCRSWVQASSILNFNLRVSVPAKFNFEKSEWQTWKKYPIEFVENPQIAAKNADLVVTDAWVSMGFEESRKNSEKLFRKYQVNSQIMQLAKKSAVFMHCLPAYRGLEVTEEVIESKQSLVWDEAENRLWAQNALMEFLINCKKC